MTWSRRAAERGSPRGKYSMGLAYYHGRGVPRDYAEALRWYRQAAEAGYAQAMNNLAIMYGLGEGVPRYDTQAYAWFIIATERGDENARMNRDLTAAELDEATRARGDARAQELARTIP